MLQIHYYIVTHSMTMRNLKNLFYAPSLLIDFWYAEYSYKPLLNLRSELTCY